MKIVLFPTARQHFYVTRELQQFNFPKVGQLL